MPTQRNVDDVLAAAPKEVRDLVQSQLSSIVDGSPQGLRLGALAGLVVAPWSASSGMKHLRTTVLAVRWPLFAIAVMFGLAVIYRYAPNRAEPRWNWVSVGAAFATLIWLAASVGFSIYSVVVMMLWLYISAYVTVAGAELNAELERQTARDTTTGRPEVMGRRDAYAADTLGESPRSSGAPNREVRA